jgi:hypothetical protein
MASPRARSASRIASRERRGRRLEVHGGQELRECVGLRVLLQNKVSGGIRRCAGGRGRR